MEISNVFAHKAQALKEAIVALQEAETKMSGFLHFISCSDCQRPLLMKLIRTNGKIIHSNDAARLACNVLKETLEIPLDPEDLVYEEKFTKGK